MPTLTIRLLGPPRVERDGRAVAFDTRKALALLAYVAECRRPVRRDTLAQLLWPDYTAARALANLRRTLWSIRSALGERWVAVTPAEVELALGDDLWVDLTHFRQLLDRCRAHCRRPEETCPSCVERLSEAVGLVRGPFLEGFSLSDSAEFDDWQALQAAGARQSYADALWRLAEGRAAQGELHQAVEVARRLVELDPLHEGAQRRLMLLYAWVGRHSEALRHYHELERLLERELGVAPEQETVELLAAIRARREPPPPAARTALRAPTAPRGAAKAGGELRGSSGGLVAREQELGRLDGLLRAALGGEARVIFITGEAGSGKTALLEEFGRRAEAAHPGLVAALGSCNAYIGAGDPYLPFRQILEQLAGEGQGEPDGARRGHAPPSVARALVAHGPDLLGAMLPADTLLERAARGAAGDEPWLQQLRRLAADDRRLADVSLQQRSLFEQYARVLCALAQERPLLLCLDDLQWADLGSINLLLHLGRRIAGQPLLIVGAYRSADVALGRGGERHPLEPAVHELQRIYGEPPIDLSAAASRHFIDALLDQRPNRLDERFRATLYRQTGGQPLFTVELLRGMRERGDLSYDEEGRLVARPEIDWDRLPAKVDAVIAERIGRLEHPDRELLWVASVEGEEFSAEVAAQVLGLDAGEALRRLSGRLDRTHHLVRATGVRLAGGRRLSRYRFRHFLIQRYLYRSLDAAERAHWHERVHAALAALYGEQSEAAAELARHAEEAGRIDLAAGHLRQAGDYALRLLANAEAAEHYRRALALLERLPETRERRLQEMGLWASLSKPLQLTMGYPAAEVARAFERAVQLGRTLGSPPELRELLGRYVHYLATRGEHRAARSVADELLALALQVEDEMLLLDAFTAKGINCFYLGELDAARDWIDRALGHYDRARHDGLTYAYGIEHSVHIRAYAMLACWLLGEAGRAREIQALLLADARAGGHPHTLAFALAFSALLESLRRDAAAALATTAEAIPLCEEHSFRLMLGLSQCVRSWALSAAGAPAEGLALYQVARESAERAQVQVLMPYLGSLLAEILWRCGHADEARATAEGALALAEQTGERCLLQPMRRIRDDILPA